MKLEARLDYKFFLWIHGTGHLELICLNLLVVVGLIWVGSVERAFQSTFFIVLVLVTGILDIGVFIVYPREIRMMKFSVDKSGITYYSSFRIKNFVSWTDSEKLSLSDKYFSIRNGDSERKFFYHHYMNGDILRCEIERMLGQDSA